MIRALRRLIRPAVIAVISALPSPEKCGCAARKTRLLEYIRSI